MPDEPLTTQFFGTPLHQATTVVVLLHGRGASAASLIPLAQELASDEIAFVLPENPRASWYPYSFLAPIERNEPYLSGSLTQLDHLLQDLLAAGRTSAEIVIGGFSQGACLALEYAARHARRYHAILGFSGGLIGPPGTPRLYTGQFEQTPIFLGCSDIDPHIPAARVQETDLVLRKMGAQVTTRLYANMGHTINEEEIRIARSLIA